MNADNPDRAASDLRKARVARIAQSALRAIRTILIRINRDWERCGKASCARSRRCRGFACEPEHLSRPRPEERT